MCHVLLSKFIGGSEEGAVQGGPRGVGMGLSRREVVKGARNISARAWPRKGGGKGSCLILTSHSGTCPDDILRHAVLLS